MPDITKTMASLEKNGMHPVFFATAKQALAYLQEQIHDTSVGIGGSMTIKQMGVYEALSAQNTVYWHWLNPQVRDQANAAETYLLSANALSEDGQIVNIDGTGNRVAAAIYGPKRVFYLVGTNKITPDLPSAMHRARNVASPLNAKRLGMKTPCAVKGDRCYQCTSPDKICAVTTITELAPGHTQVQVVLIDQPLGY